MKRLYLLFLLVAVSFTASAQHSSNAYRKLADSLYRHHHYQAAGSYYQKAIKKSPEPGSVMLQVAKCYSKTNSFADAELWFTKAKAGRAVFKREDTYEYTKVLMILKKRREASDVLSQRLKDDPNDLEARKLLDDVENFSKYYKDSSAYDVFSLAINTEVSEFAPAFYKDGIVFTAATPEKFAKKRYHWDNSSFLNLYYSVKANDQQLLKPVLFERDLNTKYHDGPATFYSDYEKMIVNRNQPSLMEGKKDTFIWRLTLFDATSTVSKPGWNVNLLPFDQPPYSFAHPTINENGSILFFISDIPGGYGGTDIYRSIKMNGVWGAPFNLGPTINTSGNEVFPFFAENTLYFASSGHGGMGGLDIFKSHHTVNGFTPPVNLGSPINSASDDLSLITRGDLHTGYFSSSRNGNDDLFSFRKADPVTHLAAHVFDVTTKQPAGNSIIQVITLAGDDMHLTADANGDIQFDLPVESAFVLIGSKDGKVGMASGSAESSEDKNHMTHQVPLLGDTARIACIGTVKDEDGVAINASSVVIVDESTGKKIDFGKDNSVISFLGEKDHHYRIEVKNTQGDTATHKLALRADETGSKTWNMVLIETRKEMSFAARIFDASDNRSLGGASVKIITFDQADQELTANADGVVEFQLLQGSAFVVIGSKDNLTGMYSGVAEPGLDKASVVHPVPAHGDPPPAKIPVIALVSNIDGEVLDKATAIVTNKVTGEVIEAGIENGVLTFLAERGKEYNISVSHQDHDTSLTEVHIPADATSIEKMALVLDKTKPAVLLFAARVFNVADNSPLAGADVKIISFSEPDLELTAGADGVVDFNLPDGTAFIVVGSKNGFVGTYSGIAVKEEDKSVMVHPVPASSEPQKELPVVARVEDTNGSMLTDAVVTVVEKSTGKKIVPQFEDGLMSFAGEKGKEYIVTVEHKDHHTTTEQVNIPAQATEVEKLSLTMQRKPQMMVRQMSVRAFKATDQSPLSNAEIKIISFTEPDIDVVANKDGVADFILPDETAYMVVANKNGFVGMHSGTAEQGMEKNSIVHPVPTASESAKELSVVGRITNSSEELLTDAVVVVTEKISGKTIESKVSDGLLTFSGEKGKTYNISVSHQDHNTRTETIAITKNPEVDVQKVSIGLIRKELPLTLLMSARVFKAVDRSPLGGADVKVISFTEPDLELVADRHGVVDFKLPAGTAYMIVGSKDGFVGMYSGTAEKGEEKSMIEHPVPASSEPERELPVVGRIVSTNGVVVDDAEISVVEKTSGKIIPAKISEGLLNFSGEKGKVYTVSVSHNDHDAVTQDIAIPAAGEDVQKHSIVLTPNGKTAPLYTMSAQVLNAADQSALAGATVRIISFTGDDQELIANSDGTVDFTLPEGTAYLIIATKDGVSGMYSGMAEKGEDKNSVIHEVTASSEPKNALPVAGRITGANGEVLTEANVKVIDKATGKEIPATLHDGVLGFIGEKGKEYMVTASHADHHSETQTVKIASASDDVQKVSFELKKKEATSLSREMAARVLNGSNQDALAGATVKIITFIGEDQELIADKDGKFNFTLPEGTAYLIIASKDGATGMYSGTAVKSTDRSNTVHSISTHDMAGNQLPVFVLIADEKGSPVNSATIEVTDKTTGQKIPFRIEKGIVSFQGEKGKEYSIAIQGDNYNTISRDIGLASSAAEASIHRITLTSVRVPSSTALLIMMETKDGSPKAYVNVGDGSHFGEIVETDGILYLKNDRGESKSLGAGTLQKIKENGSAYIASLGFPGLRMISLKNIYFDYDRSLLDNDDQKELDKVKEVLLSFPELKLAVGAHADDRGRENYNLNLSKRRARAVSTYLKKAGVPKDRVSVEAFGETIPAVPCLTQECTEEQHQKNRRAEFALGTMTASAALPVVSTPGISKVVIAFSDVLKKYGNEQRDGVVYKVCVGAYRRNSSLSFNELKDIGTVESVQSPGGITYYYLPAQTTLGKAEDMRLRAVQRGVKDAWISISQNGEKISLQALIALME